MLHIRQTTFDFAKISARSPVGRVPTKFRVALLREVSEQQVLLGAARTINV